MTTVSDRPTRSWSLHPDSMKVNNEPPGSHLHSPVAKSSKQLYSLRKHSRYTSDSRDPAATCHGVVEEDICRYLFDHSTLAPTTGFLILTLVKAREFFKNNTVDGASIWTRLGNQVTICLATPNGWETSQQVRLYRPSMAIISNDNDTRHRHSFVRHASSVDYCQRSTTNLACASLLRVRLQYITL